MGDVWPCPSLARSLDTAGKTRVEGEDFVAFHKLTQWLCYSLLEPIESEAHWVIRRVPEQTGLPEVCPCCTPILTSQYRNGGLLVDHGLISIRGDTLPDDAYPNGRDGLPVLAPSHPAVVEWRATTVIAL